MKQTILLTGVCGFIGSNFIRQVVAKYPEYRWIGIDNMSFDYCLYNQFNYSNYKFYLADFTNEHIIDRIFKIEKPNIIIHLGAMSFVNHSFEDPSLFIKSNVLGTQVLLNACIKYGIDRFVYCNTDEVFGSHSSINDSPWKEDAPKQPKNPYSASKAAGEHIVMGAYETHKIPYNITYCSNVFGMRQPYNRNLVPKIIYSNLNNQPMPIYGNGSHRREYIFVDDKINAIMTIIRKGKINEAYCIGSGDEFSNIEMINKIDNMLGKKTEINFTTDRKSHDFRYAIDCSKLQKLGWQKTKSFDERLIEYIEWFKKNPKYYG